MTDRLTHLDEFGRPRMVDVSAKAETERTATARGRIVFWPDVYRRLRGEGSPKGDVLRLCELAGIIGAKKTADLIPLCHPLPLTSVSVEASYDDAAQTIEIVARVSATAKTGVEMEALTAVAAACLTVYDMTKAIDRAMTIGPIELVEKSGGRSSDFRR